MKKYVYSCGLLATHSQLTKPTLCKICAVIDADGATLRVENGHNLAVINALGKIKLTSQEWDDRPLDENEFTRWGFEKFGLKIG